MSKIKFTLFALLTLFGLISWFPTQVDSGYYIIPKPEALIPQKGAFEITRETKYILGTQGNVWTEYMKTTDYVEYMILPRMTALSEIVWTPKDDKNWKDFDSRLQHIVKRYDAMGLNYAKHSIKKVTK
jgi:hexosaminidase